MLFVLITLLSFTAIPTVADAKCSYPQIEKLNQVFPAHGVGNLDRHFQMSRRGVRAVAEYAGFSPRQAAVMEQIARGESHRYPGLISWDRGHGLWQNTPRVWGTLALNYLRRLGGVRALRNPVKNAKMARFLYRYGGLSPWFGTQFLNPSAVPRGIDSALYCV
jgi:hypothetical protein